MAQFFFPQLTMTSPCHPRPSPTRQKQRVGLRLTLSTRGRRVPRLPRLPSQLLWLYHLSRVAARPCQTPASRNIFLILILLQTFYIIGYSCLEKKFFRINRLLGVWVVIGMSWEEHGRCTPFAVRSKAVHTICDKSLPQTSKVESLRTSQVGTWPSGRFVFREVTEHKPRKNQ